MENYLRCDKNLPVEWPEPSQPGIGHLSGRGGPLKSTGSMGGVRGVPFAAAVGKPGPKPGGCVPTTTPSGCVPYCGLPCGLEDVTEFEADRSTAGAPEGEGEPLCLGCCCGCCVDVDCAVDDRNVFAHIVAAVVVVVAHFVIVVLAVHDDHYEFSNDTKLRQLCISQQIWSSLDTKKVNDFLLTIDITTLLLLLVALLFDSAHYILHPANALKWKCQAIARLYRRPIRYDLQIIWNSSLIAEARKKKEKMVSNGLLPHARSYEILDETML
uniref:Uncharacterized protein n=1 Tax=Glossina pallidipes TaxID=7398 RepID=A0A1A9ZQB4_GLOPL